MKNRAGTYVSNLSGYMSYQSFKPVPLPPIPSLTLNNEVIFKLVEASKNLTLLDALANFVPNINLFVSMYVRKEALLSSQIEGTQCTLEDIFDPLIEENTNQNVLDVVNYIKATEYALDRLNTLPLDNKLIKGIHKILITEQEKSPGEFRYSQNWIGGQNSNIKTARYIPPNVLDMQEAMSDLEKYINCDDSLDPLIQAALIHYQFETIHPFLDGNGRIGRLLITLFLIDKKVISCPALYISYFLKMNRIEYYDRMSQVRKTGDYEQWVLFFLQALADSSSDAIDTIDKLTKLHNNNINILDDISPRQKTNVLKVFNYLEKNPIIDIQKTTNALSLSYNTVAKAVLLLADKGILRQSAKSGKTKIYSYFDYLDILRKDT